MLAFLAVLIGIAVLVRAAIVGFHRLMRRLQDPSIERWRRSR